MNKEVSLGCLAAALLAMFVPAAAADHLPLDAVGALHQYCADQAATPHKPLVVMQQPVMTDELATFGGTIFVAVYTPQVSTSRNNARMAVRVWIRRADGSREKLGKMVARQVSEGVAEAEMQVPVAVREGDTIIWRYRFRDFAELDADECFLLIGAAAKP